MYCMCKMAGKIYIYFDVYGAERARGSRLCVRTTIIIIHFLGLFSHPGMFSIVITVTFQFQLQFISMHGRSSRTGDKCVPILLPPTHVT